MSVKSYRDLIVWQKGIELAKETYRITRRFPDSERFGLAGQVQRAAVSVPSNIAEGQSRRSTREFRQFLYQALGSLAEVDTQLVLARELGYLKPGDSDAAEALVTELRIMTYSLVNRLPERRPPGRLPTTDHRPPTTGRS
ncbi:MAG TPA: four helix bundle protein [Anaerolineales bacterium]|nr:four helix bundle protein [Anaerolineales bacterium]